MSFPSERGSLELCLGSFLELVHRLIYLLASILHVAGSHEDDFNDMYLCGGTIMDLLDILSDIRRGPTYIVYACLACKLGTCIRFIYSTLSPCDKTLQGLSRIGDH